MVYLKWYVNRLKAMNAKEMLWRLHQKKLQKYEQKVFMNEKIQITSEIFSKELSYLMLDEKRLGLNTLNQMYSFSRSISIFEKYNYEDYKKKWHAGFQSDAVWPFEFSYNTIFRSSNDIGDLRTNWELNRHFQFVILAKNYFISKDNRYLEEFIEIFDDWNMNNPFLYGVSWTSAMEIAIRVNSWVFCYCFLKQSDNVPEKLLEELRIGIINMTEYVTKHYSRYSSANNHLIIEAYSTCLAGIVFNYKPWINKATEILDNEIVIQNYSDGINKELSLHYQTFVMEAFGLLIRIMNLNDIKVPTTWLRILHKMSQYVANCTGKYGEVIVFGDNDEGKILDLQGKTFDHYKYVLELMSLQLAERYVDLSCVCENIRWLFPEEAIKVCQGKKKYDNSKSITYKEGGNTLLKSNDGRVIIGIDHSALGYGKLAAHGHADALSFQMMIDGKNIFIDSGTYLYNGDKKARDDFRSTLNHNTIEINGLNQSEILGSFLWGKKANTTLIKSELSEKVDNLIVEHDGYKPIIHRREFIFNKKDELIIVDNLYGVNFDYVYTLLLDPQIRLIKSCKQAVMLQKEDILINFQYNLIDELKIEDTNVSAIYGKRETTKAIRIKGHSKEELVLITKIQFGAQ